MVASLASLAACDVVWGLSGEPNACALRSFDGLDAVDMVTGGDRFSVSGNGGLAVVENEGMLFERDLVAEGSPLLLDLGPYSPMSVAMAPEGTLLFHSGAIEPPLLQVAERNADGTWVKADRAPPKGVFAGVPSATDFGPRRVIVRTKFGGPVVQEYEDDGVAWRPVGEPQPLPGAESGNLTENGLTMVFVELDLVSNTPSVFAASRDSVSEWFGAPQLLRAGGSASAAQLIGKKTCDTLFVSEPGALQRYAR